MRKYSLTWIVLALIAATGCATSPLPQEQREIKSTEATAVTKTQGYTNLLTYLGKTLVDSNSSIKVKDQEQGLVVFRISVDCPAMRPGLDLVAAYNALFNVEVNLKDQKVRTILEAISYERRAAGQINEYVISDESKMKDARTCGEQLKRDLVGAINSTSAKKDANW